MGAEQERVEAGDDAGLARRSGAAVARPLVAVHAALLRGIHAIGWQWVRRIVATLYFLSCLAIVVVDGVPTGRQAIAILIVSGLAITRLGRGWHSLLQVVIDWLPFTLVLVAYDKTRAVADAIGLPLHEGDIVNAERWLCGGIPTVWLQEHLYSPQHVHWYDAFATLVYSSHFIATPVLAAVLWLRQRSEWLRYISRVIVLSFAGLVTYALFPEAPPWMAARDGYITQPIARLSANGWRWLHLGNVQHALSHAQEAGSNPVAAMPSLHVGFACLVALFIGTRLHSWWRYALVLYPLSMAVTLVYTGEHYVLDLLAGAAYAVGAHLGLNTWERHRKARLSDGIDGINGANDTSGTDGSGGTNVSDGTNVSSGTTGASVTKMAL